VFVQIWFNLNEQEKITIAELDNVETNVPGSCLALLLMCC